MEGCRLWSTQTRDGRFLQVSRRFLVSPLTERRNLVQRANEYEITISLSLSLCLEPTIPNVIMLVWKPLVYSEASVGLSMFLSNWLLQWFYIFSQRAENVRNGSMTTKANLMQLLPPYVAPVTANSMANRFFSILFFTVWFRSSRWIIATSTTANDD